MKATMDLILKLKPEYFAIREEGKNQSVWRLTESVYQQRRPRKCQGFEVLHKSNNNTSDTLFTTFTLLLLLCCSCPQKISISAAPVLISHINDYWWVSVTKLVVLILSALYHRSRLSFDDILFRRYRILTVSRVQIFSKDESDGFCIDFLLPPQSVRVLPLFIIFCVNHWGLIKT